MLKVLIVDDEELIRLGIASKIKKSHFEISEIAHAQNALEALSIAQELQPDIVLCDITMDGANGLTLSRQLVTLQPHIKIIIISGYSEFAYAQEAIQIGVVDYLSKPVDTGLLYGALEKCIILIQKQKQSSEALSIMNKNQQRKKLRTYAVDFLDKRATDVSVLFSNYRHDHSLFQVFYLYLDQSFFLFVDSFMEDIVQLYPFIILGENLLYYEYRHNEYLIALCINSDDERKMCENMQIIITRTLHIELQKILPSQYTIGISALGHDLRLAVSQAIDAMEHRILCENKEYIRFDDTAGFTVPYKPNPSYLSVLKHALQKLEPRKALDVLDSLNKDLKRAHFSYDSLQSLYFHLLILLDELCEGSTGIGSTPYPKEIYYFSSIWDMIDFLKDAYLDEIQMLENSTLSNGYRQETIRQAQEYVDQNYANEISLKDVSEMLHINYCYLSILFKEVMNINFSDYVIHVRIEHAKELFSSDRYKIKDVAVLTGFNNQHYFSKIFKKITCLTPKEFKEMQQS